MKQEKKRKQTFVYKGVQPELVDHVAGMVNPFSDEAEHSKIHDANASKTFCFQSRQYKTVEINSNGMGYTEFYPALKDYVKGVNTNGAGTAAMLPTSGTLSAGATFTSVDVADYTNLAAVAYRYRIVSWGIRITCVTEALGTKGELLIRELDAIGALQGVGTFGISDNTVRIPITHDMNICIVPNSVGESYKDFRNVTTTYATEQADVAIEAAYRHVGLTLIGCDNDQAADTTKIILTAEVVYNLEILPTIGSIGMRMASPPAPHSNTILEAVHNTRAATPLVNSAPSLWQKVKKIAGQALLGVGEMALGRVGGLLGNYIQSKRMLPQIADYTRNRMLLTNG
jgi:hypothetical protein